MTFSINFSQIYFFIFNCISTLSCSIFWCKNKQKTVFLLCLIIEIFILMSVIHYGSTSDSPNLNIITSDNLGLKYFNRNINCVLPNPCPRWIHNGQLLRVICIVIIVASWTMPSIVIVCLIFLFPHVHRDDIDHNICGAVEQFLFTFK